MQFLNTLDYSIIALYTVIVIGLGFYLHKKASSSIEDYFLAGRKLPWWLLGCSGMASWFDIAGTMLICSFIYMLGPRALFIEGFRGGAGLVLVFMLCFTGKWHRRSGCMTQAEWMSYRFGPGKSGETARLLTAISSIVLVIGGLAYLVRGVGLFLSMFIPLSPFYCALIMVGVATVYTMFSGFYGVVFTDVFQAVIITIGAIVISVMAFNMIPDIGSLAQVAQEITGNADWATSAPAWKTTMPAGYTQYSMMGLFAIFYLFNTFIKGLHTGGDPKYFGARNEKECGLLSFLWNYLIMFRWPMMIGFATLGIYMIQRDIPDQSTLTAAADLIKNSFPGIEKIQWYDTVAGIIHSGPGEFVQLKQGLIANLGDNWTNMLNMLSFEGTVNPERILPAVIVDSVPMGLRGLIIVALIAASMSTFDSTVNAATAFVVRDIYQRHIRPHGKTKEMMMVSYITIITLVILGFILGYYAKSINEIWVFIITCLTVGIWVPPMLRFYWWRLNGWGVAIGTAIGTILPIVMRGQLDNMGASANKLLHYIANTNIDLKNYSEMIQFAFVLTVVLGATVIGSLLTPATSKPVLRHFYLTTRPFGWWGPVKTGIDKEVLASMHKEHVNDAISVPFAFFWQIMPYFILMQLVIHAWGSLLWSIPIYTVACIGLYWFWYRNLDASNTSTDTLAYDAINPINEEEDEKLAHV